MTKSGSAASYQKNAAAVTGRRPGARLLPIVIQILVLLVFVFVFLLALMRKGKGKGKRERKTRTKKENLIGVLRQDHRHVVDAAVGVGRVDQLLRSRFEIAA